MGRPVGLEQWQLHRGFAHGGLVFDVVERLSVSVLLAAMLACKRNGSDDGAVYGVE